MSTENNISDQLSEVQPVELPQTEPDNLPPVISKKSEMTQAEKDSWFVENLRNDYSKLDQFQRSAVDFIK